MTSSTSILIAMANLTRGKRHQLDRLSIELRKAGLISKGGRGPYAASISPREVGNMLIAYMGTDGGSGGVKAVTENSPLIPKNGESFFGFGPINFGDALEEIFTDTNLASKIEKVSVCRTYPAAWIFYKVGNKSICLEFQPEEGYVEDAWSEVETDSKIIRPLMRVDCTIDGDVISQLAFSLIERDPQEEADYLRKKIQEREEMRRHGKAKN
ncbi:MAG: hypothetical protein JRI85_14885 [Deltaproteobacteria bacterium]|nr:hypothetical protein [Deltaproteobacteria bacterium]